MKALVFEIIKSELAIFHDEGLQVYEVLKKSIEEEQPIVLVFSKIERCSTQFLNAAIGKLYLLNDPSKVNKYLSFDYAELPHLSTKISEVRENAINSKNYDQFVTIATT